MGTRSGGITVCYRHNRKIYAPDGFESVQAPAISVDLQHIEADGQQHLPELIHLITERPTMSNDQTRTPADSRFRPAITSFTLSTQLAPPQSGIDHRPGSRRPAG